MTDIQEWIDQGKTLADHATQGPWEASTDSDYQPAGYPPIIEHLVYAGAVETPIIDWGNVSTKEDTEFIADARTRLPQALAALQAVLDLHQDRGDGVCYECSDGFLANDPRPTVASHPCPTVQAVQTALGQDA